jgi:hypothetical protein
MVITIEASLPLHQDGLQDNMIRHMLKKVEGCTGELLPDAGNQTLYIEPGSPAAEQAIEMLTKEATYMFSTCLNDYRPGTNINYCVDKFRWDCEGAAIDGSDDSHLEGVRYNIKEEFECHLKMADLAYKRKMYRVSRYRDKLEEFKL